MITSICKTIVKSINASTCLKIMQALVIFHDKSALYREMYDLADVFWLENTLLCSQNESYLEQPWSVVSHLLSRADYNEDSIELLDEATHVWQTVARTMISPRIFPTAIGIIFYSSSWVIGLIYCVL